MNIPHVLAQVIRRSPSLSRILDATVELVAKEMGMDVCSIYLLDPAAKKIRLAATHGLNKEGLDKVVLAPGEGITGAVLSEMRAIAADDAEAHPGYRYFPETGEERFHAYLGVPMAIRNRPVGAIAVQSLEKRVFSSAEIETLHTIAAQLVGVVENARLVQALDEPDHGRHYLHELRRWNRGVSDSAAPVSEGEISCSGNAASGGIAIGKAIYRGGYDASVGQHTVEGLDPARENDALDVAIEKARGDVLRIQEAAEKETDEEHAIIFTSHLLLLNDPTLMERLRRAIDERCSAPQAVDRVFAQIESQLESISDVYLQERAEDVRDLRNRLLSYLIDGPAPTRGVAQSIVVTQSIPPSLVVELKVQGALAIVTQRGGTTSHGALLARAMGIPAVTGVSEIDAVQSGDEVIVDGSRGTVVVRPSAKTLKKYRKREDRLAKRRSRLESLRDEPARSVDGETVTLLANVSLANEVRQAMLYGAEGVGLYRTEFPFLIREDFPTREEQARIYRRVIEAFPEGRIQFRILDLGGDKSHPRITRSDEPNPVLGYRSIRLLLDYPKLLKEQVQAFAQVGGSRRIGVLIPMVSAMDELRRTKALIEEALAELGGERPAPRIGVMIELPAAVEIAYELASESDFLSIGTNDLIQFTIGVDRENARVAPFANPYHPAVLRMIRRVIASAGRAGKPVGCCGEMSSNPELAALLLAMGIESLSLTPSTIPIVKETIRRCDIGRLRAKLDGILELDESSLIRDALRDEVDPKD